MKKGRKKVVKNNIKELKLRNNMTYGQIAEASDYSESYICQLATGSRKNPSYLAMERIAFAFESSVAKVFKIESTPKMMGSKCEF